MPTDRDQPTILLSSAWIAHHGGQVDTIPDGDLDQAYRAARDLANSLGAERYRRASANDENTGRHTIVIRHDNRPASDDVVTLAAVIAAACGRAYERDCLPSSLTIADAILADGYHRHEGAPCTPTT